MTTERPMLFSAPMIRALLAGTKSQTRRVVKDTGLYAIDAAIHGAETAARELQALASRCPYGQPGDQLWVREAHSIGPGPGVPLEPGETAGALRWPHVTYAADGAVERRDTRWKGAFGVRRPSIHMFRWASRITLTVTQIRVERLHDISEADARAEGYELGAPPCIDDPLRWYRHLWDQINGAGAWEQSPWVWVVEFRRVTP